MALITEGRVFPLIAFILAWVATYVAVGMGKEGKIHIRRIPGLDAIEEVIGRSVEMGRPVFDIIGMGQFTDIYATQTIAGLSILSYVAELCARLGAKLYAPQARVDVMPVAVELVRDAYRAEGKLDELDVDEQMPYLSGTQFAWASGIIGMAARMKPAGNIMIGPFWAESMMFAESFDRVGAMQVGGTARTYQIPFFAALCDYVLIGEEIFAAGAYVSKDPQQIGSIAAQDWYKMAAIIISIIGALLSTAGINIITEILSR
ncbi:MAG TPA: hypothetical protein ENF19_01000 [Candidatus Bathyarchaeota archaeon]|nr:hypothetical protein [Candidatus Bathyarchaeota archaeon]